MFPEGGSSHVGLRLDGCGSTEQEPLAQTNAKFEQRSALVLRFDAFGDELATGFPGEVGEA